MNTMLSFLSADKPDNVSLNIPTTKVCAGTPVTFKCSAGAANPAVQNYTLYKFVNGLTYVSSNQAGVFTQTLNIKGQHKYRCEGSNLLAPTSSNNRSLEVHGEFDIEIFRLQEVVCTAFLYFVEYLIDLKGIVYGYLHYVEVTDCNPRLKAKDHKKYFISSKVIMKEPRRPVVLS